MLTLQGFLHVGLLILSLGFTAFFACAEAGLFRVDPLKVKAMADDGDPSAHIISGMLEHKERLLGILLTGTNISMVLGTVLMTSLVDEFNLFGDMGPFLAAAGMIILVLIFGEVLPKTYAAKNATRVSLSLAKPLRIVYRVLLPISIPFESLPKLILRLLKGTYDDNLTVTEDAILTMVSIGKEEGEVGEEEGEMIEAVLESDDTLVRDLMVPRVDMVYANLEDDPLKVVDVALEAGFSRIPVYEGSIDNVVGIVCVKDLLSLFSISPGSEGLCSFLRPVHYVPETKSVMELLKELKEKQLYMAIVLDEFGGTAGLITMEDLIEEIVGDIRDEYDDDEEEAVVALEDGSYIIDGRTPLDEINELLDVNLPEGEFSTIGGLLYSEIGRVPENADEILLNDSSYRLIAEEVYGRKIEKVRLIIEDHNSTELKHIS